MPFCPANLRVGVPETHATPCAAEGESGLCHFDTGLGEANSHSCN